MISGLSIDVEDTVDHTALFRGYESQASEIDLEIHPNNSIIDEMLALGYDEYSARSNMILFELASALPRYSRLLLHGVALQHLDSAYLICAPAGTGKSTHAFLWKKYLGDSVAIINGDKPILSFGEKDIRVYGTPWRGKEGWGCNTDASVSGVVFLERSQTNRIERLAPSEALDEMLRQVFLPREDSGLLTTLELVDQLLQTTPLYRLTCDMTKDAVVCSFEGLTGRSFDLCTMHAE